MTKKTKIILICAAVAVCIAVAVVCWFLFGSQPTVLYYNLDGYSYQNPSNTALSNRKPNASGVYEIDFVSDGQTITCTTTDAELVNRIDNLQVLTMKVSGNGTIQSVAAPRKPLANQDVVQQISENELVINSSLVYNGKTTTLPLAEGCRFYDLSDGGADTDPEIMDEILAFGNARGEATDIFILRRVPRSELYWRVNRKYDSKENMTTRQPDDNGVFTIPFSINGERVEMKCKDWMVMADLDKPASTDAAMGLVLDEEGYITEVLPAYRALRGRQLCSLYHVTAIDGDRITVMNKQADALFGITRQIVLGEDCKYFDVSSGATLSGQLVDGLQVGDQITVYADPVGIATHVFIHIRVLEGPLYFNLVRMYSGNRTARRPDAEGWYVFDMLCDGQIVTRKTQDQSIANTIDSYTSRGMGLKCNGDVIEKVYNVNCVTGNSVLASSRYVFEFTQAMIVSGNSRYKGLSPTLLGKGCKIYDVSNPAKPVTLTTMKQGDCFIAFGNADNQATHIFIISRK